MLIDSDYSAHFPYLNGHIETIIPALFRSVRLEYSHRERIPTPDDDFLDLDWIDQGSDALVILSHGLEGDSHQAYIKGMAKCASLHGIDAIAWNYRGCSGEVNRQKRLYHSGATDDLLLVLQHALSLRRYESIYLIGFSLGGNLTLKFLGEQGHLITEKLKAAVVFSTPMELRSSCIKLSKGINKVYTQRFLHRLRKKIRAKAAKMPDIFDLKDLGRIRTLMDFDERYTAPLHGFRNAIDYYQKCSSLRFVEKVSIPTLIINAKNDPFLPDSSFPYELLRNHPYAHLETPEQGGHCGFPTKADDGFLWSEARAIRFLKKAETDSPKH